MSVELQALRKEASDLAVVRRDATSDLLRSLRCPRRKLLSIDLDYLKQQRKASENEQHDPK